MILTTHTHRPLRHDDKVDGLDKVDKLVFKLFTGTRSSPLKGYSRKRLQRILIAGGLSKEQL